MRQVFRRFASLLIAAAVFLATAGLSHGAGSGIRMPRKFKPPKPVYTAIASVNTTAMTITVEPKNSTSTATKTYKLTPKTRVTVNGNPATLADLKPGQQIHIGAGMNADVAEELHASTPPPDPKR